MPNSRDRRRKHRPPYKHKNQSFQSSGKREYRHPDQLCEVEVGITEYISKLDGFSGIIKARYSDFQVNEINLDGIVAKLTDTRIPEDFIIKKIRYNYKEVETTPCTHIPQDVWESLKRLVEAESVDPVKLSADNLSKEQRKEIHECIRQHFGRKLVVSTINDKTVGNDNKFMEFKKFNKEETQDVREEWPENKGEYVYFLVNKEKMDTVNAQFKISSCLKISAAKLTYAGVKDKRSISTQWFCVRKVEPWKLLIRTRNLKFIRIGNLCFKDKPLKLGELQGNRFRIALRNVTGTDEQIDAAMNQVREHGFINYYGLQRFGNDKEVPTFEIGIKLLQGKWKEAIDLILKPKASDDFSSETADIAKAKKVFAETGDPIKAYKEFNNNKNKCIEAKLLEGLSKVAETDFVTALEKVPRSMRLFYMHSFQSYVWNKMVSKRIQLFGLQPVEGDLVLVNQEDNKRTADVDIDNIVANTEEEEEDQDEEFNKGRQEVKALTAGDLVNYTIYDIILPMPGYDIIYPENLKEYYKEVLESVGLSLDMPKQKCKTYNLSGNYRKITQKVQDISWKITRFNNPTDDLIRSDFDELKGNPEPRNTGDGRFKALIMEFALPPSSYATMAIREILKTNTSASSQAKLNNYHEKKTSIDLTSNESIHNSIDYNEISHKSLLSDPKKFEEFTNSIFNSTVEESKRKNDEQEGSNKKLKGDANEMEAE